MKIQAKLQLSVLCFAVGLAWAAGCGAESLRLNGNWGYVTGSEADGDLTQSYSASYRQTTDLTDLANLNAGLRYSRSVSAEGTSDRLAPSLSLNNTNDIYRLNLSTNSSIAFGENDQ